MLAEPEWVENESVRAIHLRSIGYRPCRLEMRHGTSLLSAGTLSRREGLKPPPNKSSQHLALSFRGRRESWSNAICL